MRYRDIRGHLSTFCRTNADAVQGEHDGCVIFTAFSADGMVDIQARRQGGLTLDENL